MVMHCGSLVTAFAIVAAAAADADACAARRALELVTAADSAPPGLCALARSAVRQGYRLTILGVGANATYHDVLEQKPRLLRAFLRDGAAADVVAFVDGFDVLAQRGPAAALAGWRAAGAPDALFGGESYCFPNRRGDRPAPYCAQAAAGLGAGDRVVCLGKARRFYAALGVDVDAKCAPPDAPGRVVFPFLNSGLYLGRASPRRPPAAARADEFPPRARRPRPARDAPRRVARRVSLPRRAASHGRVGTSRPTRRTRRSRASRTRRSSTTSSRRARATPPSTSRAASSSTPAARAAR